MKRVLTILLSACLLSSCASSAPSETSLSVETSVSLVAETTSTTAKASVTTSKAAITSVSGSIGEEPEQSKITPAYITVINKKAEIREADIMEELSYELPIDVTAVEGYAEAVSYLNDLIKWGETDEAAAENIKGKNYSNIVLEPIYIGSEKADWLCSADYYFISPIDYYGASYYSRLFYVKNGEITEYITDFLSGTHRITVINDKAFIPVYGDGIYELSLDTYEKKCLAKANGWCALYDVTDDYIIFTDGLIKVYNRNSGEIYDTPITYESTFGETFGIYDDSIIYGNKSGGGMLRLDMKTGEVSPADIPEDKKGEIYGSEGLNRVYSEEKYIVSIRSNVGNPESITIKSRTDMSEKTYILSELNSLFSSNGYKFFSYIGMSGDTLYACIDFSKLFVFDVSLGVGKMAVIGGEHDRSYKLYGDILIIRDYEKNTTYAQEIRLKPEVTELIPENIPTAYIEKTALFNEADIIEELGFDLPIELDIETMKKETEDYANYWLDDNGEDYIKEYLERAEKQNYMDVLLDYEYVGNERADWVCTVNYYDYYAPIFSYTTCYYGKLIYIKDGKVSEVAAEFDSEIYYMAVYKDKAYVPVYDDGIYELDMSENILKKLINIGAEGKESYNKWCLVDYADDNFVVYSDGIRNALSVYNLNSGTTQNSEILRERDNGMMAHYKGNCIYYPDYSVYPIEGYKAFNMETGETSFSEISADEFEEMFYKDYMLFGDCRLYKSEEGEPPTITSENISEKTKTVYLLGGTDDAFSEENYVGLYFIGIRDNKLYGVVNRTNLFILDMLENTITVHPLDIPIGNVSTSFPNDGLAIRDYSRDKAYILNIETDTSLLMDEEGYLSEKFGEKINELLSENENKGFIPYIALQDFDSDSLPEIILIKHNSGQGLMPCEIYRAGTLECIGTFEGYSRDGFTRYGKDKDGVIIHNYYEHSVHLRYESFDLAEYSDDKVSVTNVYENGGAFNATGAYNAGIKWKEDRDKLFSYLFREAEYYDVSDFWKDDVDTADYVVSLYNGYKRLENIYTAIEFKEEKEWAFFAAGDYDSDGKPEAFFQTPNEMKTYFMNNKGEISVVSENDNGFGAVYSAYRVWNSFIVFSYVGNHTSDMVFTVENGKPKMLLDYGQSFYYSELYNGMYSLTQSAYDAPSHTWKPYPYSFNEKGELYELGAIEVDKEEFLNYYGEDAQAIFDEIAAMVPPVEGETKYEIRSIYYRGDMSYNINYGWDVINEYITVKPTCYGEKAGLVEYSRGNGAYLAAFNPEIAVYPERPFPEK